MSISLHSPSRCFLGSDVSLGRGISVLGCVLETAVALTRDPPRGSHISRVEGAEPCVRPLQGGGDWVCSEGGRATDADDSSCDGMSSDFSSDEEDEVDHGAKRITSFRKEVEESVFSAYKDVLSSELVEKTLFEMRSSRSAFNLQYEEAQNIALEVRCFLAFISFHFCFHLFYFHLFISIYCLNKLDKILFK